MNGWGFSLTFGLSKSLQRVRFARLGTSRAFQPVAPETLSGSVFMDCMQ
jgi:hypothetical protein